MGNFCSHELRAKQKKLERRQSLRWTVGKHNNLGKTNEECKLFPLSLSLSLTLTYTHTHPLRQLRKQVTKHGTGSQLGANLTTF